MGIPEALHTCMRKLQQSVGELKPMLTNESATRFLFQLSVPRRKNTTERPRTKPLQPPLLRVMLTTVRLTTAKELLPSITAKNECDDSEADLCQNSTATTAKSEGDDYVIDHCPRATATTSTSQADDCEVDHCQGATATTTKSEGDDNDHDARQPM